jgi:hypothetical protein
MFKYISFIVYTLFCLFAGYYFGWKGIDSFKQRPTAINDTTLIQKWDKKIQRDTVTSLLDKITSKKINSSKVLYQNIDSSYLKKIERLNTIIDVNKKGDSLKVLSINFDKKIVREFSFPSSLKEFTIVAQDENVFYTESRNLFSFHGITIGAGADYLFRNSKKQYFFEIMTGFNIFGHIGISFKANTKYEAGIRVYYNL